MLSIILSRDFATNSSVDICNVVQLWKHVHAVNISFFTSVP